MARRVVRTVARSRSETLEGTGRFASQTWQNRSVTDDDVLEAFRRAAGDRVHGAAEIEERLISDLLASRASWTRHQLSIGADLLAGAQSAMAPLAAIARRIGAGDMEGLQSFIEQRLGVLKLVPETLAARAMPWIERAAVVVSISRSSSVAAVLDGAWRKRWKGTVVILDGSSAGGGVEQAVLLAENGTVVSQPDAAAPRWLDEPRTLVAVGADAVGPDRFVNCVGTKMLLELANARNLPAILVADRGKDVSEQKLESIAEALPMHRDGPGREWPLFEVVSMDLVTARILD